MNSRRIAFHGLLSATVFAAALTGCTSVNETVNTGPQNTVVESDERVLAPGVQMSEDRKTFVRDGGWSIPAIVAAKKVQNKRNIRLDDGREVQVEAVVQNLEPFIVTDEPFASIASSIGKTQIREVTEFRTAAGVFCYRISVNRVFVDENTNTITSTQGVMFNYSYYGEDGDGKFETLSMNSTEPKGRPTPFDPHIPDWATRTKADKK